MDSLTQGVGFHSLSYQRRLCLHTLSVLFMLQKDAGRRSSPADDVCHASLPTKDPDERKVLPSMSGVISTRAPAGLIRCRQETQYNQPPSHAFGNNIQVSDRLSRSQGLRTPDAGTEARILRAGHEWRTMDIAGLGQNIHSPWACTIAVNTYSQRRTHRGHRGSKPDAFGESSDKSCFLETAMRSHGTYDGPLANRWVYAAGRVPEHRCSTPNS